MYWPTPGFKGRTVKLCALTRWDFNFRVRSSPLRGNETITFIQTGVLTYSRCLVNSTMVAVLMTSTNSNVGEGRIVPFICSDLDTDRVQVISNQDRRASLLSSRSNHWDLGPPFDGHGLRVSRTRYIGRELSLLRCESSPVERVDQTGGTAK